jgi:hypothetical protein
MVKRTRIIHLLQTGNISERGVIVKTDINRDVIAEHFGSNGELYDFECPFCGTGHLKAAQYASEFNATAGIEMIAIKSVLCPESNMNFDVSGCGIYMTAQSALEHGLIE